MSFLRALFGPSKEMVWRSLAEQVEGRFVDGGFLGTDVVQVATGDWIITLDTDTLARVDSLPRVANEPGRGATDAPPRAVEEDP